MRKETAQLHLFAIDTNNSVRSCITKPAAGRKKCKKQTRSMVTMRKGISSPHGS
uniref:Uncharacterized protein n=1 Tax=Anopheles minimus TaxID=112268 RepID=A0A182WNH3_9DIPT